MKMDELIEAIQALGMELKAFDEAYRKRNEYRVINSKIYSKPLIRARNKSFKGRTEQIMKDYIQEGARTNE